MILTISAAYRRSHYKPSKIPLTHLCTMHMQACARLGDAMRGPIPSWRFVFTRHHQRASNTSDASSGDYNTAFYDAHASVRMHDPDSIKHHAQKVPLCTPRSHLDTAPLQ